MLSLKIHSLWLQISKSPPNNSILLSNPKFENRAAHRRLQRSMAHPHVCRFRMLSKAPNPIRTMARTLRVLTKTCVETDWCQGANAEKPLNQQWQALTTLFCEISPVKYAVSSSECFPPSLASRRTAFTLEVCSVHSELRQWLLWSF